MLPDDIRSDPGLQSFNDFGGMAKSYLETKSMVGRSIQLPGKDSKPEDVEKWAGETGAKLKDHGFGISKLSDLPPANPDGYEFKIEGVTPEQLKEDKILGSFRATAHKLGVNQQTAAALLDWYLKDAVPGLKAGADQIDMVEDAAQVEAALGKVFQGQTKEMIAARDQAVLALKSEIPELADFLEGTAPFGKPWMANKDHPAMVKLLKFVADAKAQDFGGAVSGLTASDTLESVDSEIDKLRKEAAASNDQLEREKIGGKMDALYKKKAALLGMKKAS